MAQHHKYSLVDLDQLYPFELDTYISILNNYLEKKRLDQMNGL